MNSNIWKILCGIGLIFWLTGCKSPATTVVSNAGIMKTEEAFFSSVLDHSFRFNTLSARIRLEFTSQLQEFSSRVQLKMIYNDRMQLSFLPILGIEAFRIELTNDSVKILDRVNKHYMIDSYDNIKEKTDIDFNFRNLQALLTNQVFVPGESDISMKHFRRFSMTKDGNSAKIKLKDKNGFLYIFTADTEEKLLSTNIENASDNQLITWDYNDFKSINRQQFPLKMTARLSGNNNIKGTAVLTFSTPEVNGPIRAEFNIPSGYERVTLDQIIKLLVTK